MEELVYPNDFSSDRYDKQYEIIENLKSQNKNSVESFVDLLTFGDGNYYSDNNFHCDIIRHVNSKRINGDYDYITSNECQKQYKAYTTLYNIKNPMQLVKYMSENGWESKFISVNGKKQQAYYRIHKDIISTTEIIDVDKDELSNMDSIDDISLSLY
jgi:hypothetical protein